MNTFFTFIFELLTELVRGAFKILRFMLNSDFATEPHTDRPRKGQIYYSNDISSTDISCDADPSPENHFQWRIKQ